MILGVDPGLEFLGWAVLHPKTGAVAALGVIETERNPKVGVHLDRARRVTRQATQLELVAKAHAVVSIAAEEVSLGGPPMARVSMAACLGLSWGAITSSARWLSCELYALPPKQWQHAIAPAAVRTTERVTKSGKPGKPKVTVDYDTLYNALRRYVNRSCEHQLDAIPHGKRNHAIDAVGAGLFLTFNRELCARVLEVP